MHSNSLLDRIYHRAHALDGSMLLRITTLDEWSGRNRRITKKINPRSIQAHGGQIFADIRVIQALKSINSRIDRLFDWIKAFEKHYGVSFYTMKDCIYHTPQQVLDTMDRRASVLNMRVWKKRYNKARRQRILDDCNLIIRIWAEDTGDMFAPGSTEKAAFDEMDKDWWRGFNE